jgi:hypothetical protein
MPCTVISLVSRACLLSSARPWVCKPVWLTAINWFAVLQAQLPVQQEPHLGPPVPLTPEAAAAAAAAADHGMAMPGMAPPSASVSSCKLAQVADVADADACTAGAVNMGLCRCSAVDCFAAVSTTCTTLIGAVAAVTAIVAACSVCVCLGNAYAACPVYVAEHQNRLA